MIFLFFMDGTCTSSLRLQPSASTYTRKRANKKCIQLGLDGAWYHARRDTIQENKRCWSQARKRRDIYTFRLFCLRSVIRASLSFWFPAHREKINRPRWDETIRGWRNEAHTFSSKDGDYVWGVTWTIFVTDVDRQSQRPITDVRRWNCLERGDRSEW